MSRYQVNSSIMHVCSDRHRGVWLAKKKPWEGPTSDEINYIEPDEVAELVVPGDRDGQVEGCVGGIQHGDEDAPLQRDPGEGVHRPVLVQVGGRRTAQKEEL